MLNRLLLAQFREQRLSLFEVRGIEAFGEPAVNLREHRARFIAAPLMREQAGEAGGRAQLP